VLENASVLSVMIVYCLPLFLIPVLMLPEAEERVINRALYSNLHLLYLSYLMF